MGQFVEGMKFYGGSHSLMPKFSQTSPSAFKNYVVECKQMRFDTIKLNVPSLEVPEDTLLRYMRLIKAGGLKAKPQFAVKFSKSIFPLVEIEHLGLVFLLLLDQLPEFSDRFMTLSLHIFAEPVEDVGLLIRRAERCLEAGADMIMIDADGLCKHADSVRADAIAKVVGRLGLEKTIFEASNARASEWFVKQYGPRV
ncbi:hypothetical protein F3Y22_tig00112762pilonHSYRG00093 [Hibiscus syriacus]|uniref:Uncharacterized protein n=1 Tax=Hibiscus syriacus TaxID=106335 RepID=A0A6A2Y372_HIBSY|nr:hypothetical protein F3Y22_tig00112762pilonHSYRG00093 [Hibiscus syriacus]